MMSTQFALRRVAGRMFSLESGALVAVQRPALLELPVKFIQVRQAPKWMPCSAPQTHDTDSSGHSLIAALDSNRQVWVFASWLKPYQLINALLDGSTPEARAVQVEVGDMCLSIRMESGTVYVAWPFRGRAFLQMRDHFDGKPEWDEGVVHCEPWKAQIDLVRLPPIPSLPPSDPLSQEEPGFPSQLSTIAVGHNFLVGLTNFGHVLTINLEQGDLDGFDGEAGQDVGIRVLNAAIAAGRVRWEYVRKRCVIRCYALTFPSLTIVTQFQ